MSDIIQGQDGCLPKEIIDYQVSAWQCPNAYYNYRSFQSEFPLSDSYFRIICLPADYNPNRK